MLDISDSLKNNILKSSQHKELNISFKNIPSTTSNLSAINFYNFSVDSTPEKWLKEADSDCRNRYWQKGGTVDKTKEQSIISIMNFSPKDNPYNHWAKYIYDNYYEHPEKLLFDNTLYNTNIYKNPRLSVQFGLKIQNKDFIKPDMKFRFRIEGKSADTMREERKSWYSFYYFNYTAQKLLDILNDWDEYNRKHNLGDIGTCFYLNFSQALTREDPFLSIGSVSLEVVDWGSSYEQGESYSLTYLIHHAAIRILDENEDAGSFEYITKNFSYYPPSEGITLLEALNPPLAKINEKLIPDGLNFITTEENGFVYDFDFDFTLASKDAIFLRPNLFQYSTDFSKFICAKGFNHRYMCCSFQMKISNYTRGLYLGIKITYQPKTINLGIQSKILDVSLDLSKYSADTFKTAYFVIDLNDIARIVQIGFYNPNNASISVTGVRRNMMIEFSDSYIVEPSEFVHSSVLNYYENIDKFYKKETVNIDNITNNELVAESFSLTESLCSENNLKFGVCESAHCEFTCVDRNEPTKDLEIAPYLSVNNEFLPLGVYIINEVKKEYAGGFIKRTITAYDKSIKLDENAYNWYTQYMYAVTTSRYTPRYGVEYARQIYSTYFNLASKFEIEKRDYTKEKQLKFLDYETLITSGYITSVTSLGYVSGTAKLKYCKIRIEDINPAKLYVVDSYNKENAAPSYFFYPSGNLNSYLQNIDSLGRGVLDSGICVEEHHKAGSKWTYTNRYLVNSGDYFMVSPETDYIDIYIPIQVFSSSETSGIIDYVRVSELDKLVDLTNGWIRLMYYNYNTKEIFSANSSVKAREIIRSLLEVTGCFFNIDRYGNPEFKYSTKAGLYPSETLYPADDLYPRGIDGMIFTRSQYISFEAGDYSVRNYGKIQIVKQTKSNEAKSIVEWEYVGNERYINTYLIDNNVFYCSDGMQYEYDSMPEVQEMLENMYIRIASLSYSPHTTKAPGLPYLEVGDRISLLTKVGGVESFIFRRTLKGIQALRDTFEASGDEYIEAVSDYGYSEMKG